MKNTNIYLFILIVLPSFCWSLQNNANSCLSKKDNNGARQNVQWWMILTQPQSLEYYYADSNSNDLELINQDFAQFFVAHTDVPNPYLMQDQFPYDKQGIQTVSTDEIPNFPDLQAYKESIYQLWWNDQPKSESNEDETLVQNEDLYDKIRPMFIKSNVKINPKSNSKDVANFKWAHAKVTF